MDTQNGGSGEAASASATETQASASVSAPQTAAPAGGEAAKKDITMAVLSYIGILVIVSYFVKKDDPFVKFHIKQGVVLFVGEVIVWILGMILWMLWPLYDLLDLAFLAFSIIGIVHAAQGKEEDLPFIGKYSEHIKI